MVGRIISSDSPLFLETQGSAWAELSGAKLRQDLGCGGLRCRE